MSFDEGGEPRTSQPKQTAYAHPEWTGSMKTQQLLAADQEKLLSLLILQSFKLKPSYFA